jgi:two-component system sensor histidine kinase DegS
MKIEFEAPVHVPPVSPDAALALFRALQEALSNVSRHSGASAVNVRLDVLVDQLTMVVRDNGRGFVPAVASAPASSLGLAGMRERIAALHGSVTLHSSAGACVTVRLPIHAG